MTKNSGGKSVLLNDLPRKETVMRRWNIFGINAVAPSTQGVISGGGGGDAYCGKWEYRKIWDMGHHYRTKV